MPLTVLPPRLACWGDSLTTFVVPFLAQALHGQYLVENYAVGGQDSSQILSRFTAAPSTHGVPTILWAGSNNLPELSMPQALADLATMVGSLTSDYLILTPFNGENGPSYYRGGATYQQLQTFGNHPFDKTTSKPLQNGALATIYFWRFPDFFA